MNKQNLKMANPGESFQMQDPGRFEEISLGTSNEGTVSPKKGFMVDRRVWIVLIGAVGVLAVVGIAVGASAGTSADSKSATNDVINSQKDFNSKFAEALSRLSKAIHSIRHEKEADLEVNPSASKDEPIHSIRHEKEADLEVNPSASKVEIDDSHNKMKVMNPRLQDRHSSSRFPKIDVKAICQTPECAISANLILQSMNSSVDPCYDFYEFSCGGYIADHPTDNGSVGTFYAADDLLQERLEIILEATPEPTDPLALSKIHDYYTSCMDVATLDGLGLTELTDELARQGGWPMAGNFDESKFVLESAVVGVDKLRVEPLIAASGGADFHDTFTKILYVTEGILGLSSEYLLNPANHTDEIAAYKTYITTSAKLVRDSLQSGTSDAEIDAEADDMINFEMELALVMSQVKYDNLTEDLVKMTVGELQVLTDSGAPDQFLWLNFFKTMYAGTDVIITADEPCYVVVGEFMPKFAVLLSQTPTRTLANYLGWWWTMVSGPETTDEMRDARLAFNNALYGSTSLRARNDHCRDQTNYNYGFATSRSYVDDYFPAGGKAENEALVELIVTAYHQIFQGPGVDWMADEDKVLSEEKLDYINRFVAYPDWILDDTELDLTYEAMDVQVADHYGNVLRLADFIGFNDHSTFRDLPDLEFPAMPPTVVNAYYTPFSNSIDILAGILQSPFFTHGTLDALNFGGIGMVVGHELTHGFDNNGRRFDKTGNYIQWWTQQSIDNFKNLSSCFVDQYNQYSPPELIGTQYEGAKVDGQQTLGENIADNGGIHEAYLAYRTRIANIGAEEPSLPGLEEYTPDQLFFMSFANLWCEHRTTSSILSQLESDPHSPGRFRVLGSVSNDVNFAATFQCGTETEMNRGQDRCELY